MLAPGGDDIPDESDDFPDDSGESSHPSITPDEALISLALSSETNYAYWHGTSFATPLVSRLAALALDADDSEPAWLSPKQVFEAIRCGAPTGDGVINVPATLFRCLP